VGSEISREEIDAALQQRPEQCECGRRHSSILMANTSGWGGYISEGCTWCLLQARGVVGAIAWWDGRRWEQRDVGDGFVVCLLDELPSQRPQTPVPPLEDALDQFHRVTRMFRHRLDLDGWSAWVACLLNPTVPEREVVAALEVIAAFEPGKVHWANAALVDWPRLSAYAATDRARVVAHHRALLDGPHPEIYGRNAALALRRLGEQATWPPEPRTPVDGS
jgi:hypothetical protein